MGDHVQLLITKARDSAGLSQAELARRAGIPRSVMNVYERGRRVPSAEMLARLLQAAGYKLVAERVPSPVDSERAGRILEQVIELAEALPYEPKPNNNYPPLAARLAPVA